MGSRSGDWSLVASIGHLVHVVARSDAFTLVDLVNVLSEVVHRRRLAVPGLALPLRLVQAVLAVVEVVGGIVVALVVDLRVLATRLVVAIAIQ